MIQSFCLDTNVLLLLLRGKDRGKQIDQSFGLSQSLGQHVVSIVTHAELYAIVDSRGWGAANLAAMENMLRNVVTVDVSGARIVTAYRRIEQANRAKGGPHHAMGKNDLWIAATAMVTGFLLLTTDADFQHLDGKLLIVHTA